MKQKEKDHTLPKEILLYPNSTFLWIFLYMHCMQRHPNISFSIIPSCNLGSNDRYMKENALVAHRVIFGN